MLNRKGSPVDDAIERYGRWTQRDYRRGQKAQLLGLWQVRSYTCQPFFVKVITRGFLWGLNILMLRILSRSSLRAACIGLGGDFQAQYPHDRDSVDAAWFERF